MELWEKETFVSCLLDESLKHRQLIGKVILLTQEAAMQQLSFPMGRQDYTLLAIYKH